MDKPQPSVQSDAKLSKKKSNKDRSTSRSVSNEEKPAKEKKEKQEANGNSVQGRWHKSEHDRFIEAIKKFGKDWKSVEQYIETRSGSQIRSHAQKFFNRIIKKYEIDKTEVINFIQNSYDSEQSSTSATPQKKKKTDKEGGDGMASLDYKPILPNLNKQSSNYETKHKNESPKPPGTAKKAGENGHPAGNKEQELTHSISNDMSIQSANDDQNDQRRPIMAWSSQMNMLLNLAQTYAEELNSEKISGVQRHTYNTFLANFTKKIEQVKNLDINYGHRTNGMNEDYYTGYYGSHGKSHDLGHHHGEARDEADMVHHYSQYRGGNRKYSFQLPEEAEEHRFPIIHPSFDNGTFLRKRKASSD